MTVAAILGLVAQISILLTVMSYGMQSSFDDALSLFRQPVRLAKVVLSMNVIMPLFAVIVVMLFTLNPIVEVALIALSLSPVPPIMPGKALKSGADQSSVFGLLAAVSLISVIVMPFALEVIERVAQKDIQFSMQQVIKTVLITILIPLAVGLLLGNFAPSFAKRAGGLIGKVAMILLLAAFLPILLALLPVMWSLIGNGTMLAIIVFAVMGVIVGHFLGRPGPNEGRLLALATASRHPAIAIALTSANVDESASKLAAGAVLLYLLVSGFVVGLYLKLTSNEGSSIE
jgi:BASS family bile acid:Na+ symporter